MTACDFTGVVNDQSEVDIYYIPVVFHVIASSIDAEENIGLDLIENAISKLNSDFRTFDGAQLPVTIEFILAKVDPDGNCTNGVVRPAFTNLTFSVNNPGGLTTMPEPVKQHSIWDPSRYLNIWTVHDIGGVGAYSSFPFVGIPENQGVVSEYNEIERSLSHEVGHFLGLLHPHGCGGDCDDICGADDEEAKALNDFVSDTPPGFDPSPVNFDDCTLSIAFSCNQPSSVPDGPLNCTGSYSTSFYPRTNYMSQYLNCGARFEPGQYSRMYYFLNNSYRDLWYPGYLIKDEMIVDKPTNFHRDVEIFAGGRLVIESEVVMAVGTSIVVHQGGQLVVNEGRIRGCDISDSNRGLWNGISVRGRSRTDFDVEFDNSKIEDIDGYAVRMTGVSGSFLFAGNGSINANKTIFNNVEGMVLLGSFTPSLNNSVINSCIQNGGTWGVGNVNGWEVEITNNKFFDIENNCVSTTGGSYNIFRNEFHSESEDVALTHVITGLPSIVDDNDFFGEKIGVRASGSTFGPHEISNNEFFVAADISDDNINIYMDGNNNYIIENNVFLGTLGVESRSNGNFGNRVNNNEFFSNKIGINTQNNNSGYNFYENCFSSRKADVVIMGQINDEIQGVNGNPANNCFTHNGSFQNIIKDITGEHEPFTYLEPDDEFSLDCRDAFKAGGSVLRDFSGDIFNTRCGGRANGESTNMDNVQNLQDAIRNGDFELAESLIQSENGFEEMIVLFSLKIFQEEFDEAKSILNSLENLNEGQSDWRTVSFAYVNMLDDLESIEEPELLVNLEEIAMKEHTYSGYAQSLYYQFTSSFVDNLDLTFLDELEIDQRSLGLSQSNLGNTAYFYPNPAADVVNLNSTLEIESLVIYNSVGGNVFNSVKSKTIIDTRLFNNGIYWVKIKIGSGDEIVEKLIISK